MRQTVSGFEGEIFKQGGGHHKFSVRQKTAVGYRKVHFLSLTKTAFRCR
ncbi:TPA: 6-pyruvoyl tetrahydrobiopterin synthase [Citrobacter freundii]|uniref:6-pyruvoyl tetrahydrobiopterin synthase n=1 Tax=Citrobacter farmeri TaxID=67824 RepID=A0ACA8DAC0_9ENTR|nr:6-pyruvoyl tetrahydrobiopterin synthase [Citrobacter farmeri]RSB15115.1 6-pyruvoyl tetrahydrobiopterin synthase [Citrobacter farmeri]HAU5702796.1 6-pyruvoyl tetrahydrobiopterin synthase [Citrobacter freundii]